MSDEDIKKALECCLIGECEGCPISKFSDCYETLKDETMSLINRQQAEIERQQLEIEKLKELLKEWKKAAYNYADSIENIKSEAIKEFAERLKIDWQENDFYWEDADVYKWIDNLVKEMVGEQDA